VTIDLRTRRSDLSYDEIDTGGLTKSWLAAWRHSGEAVTGGVCVRSGISRYGPPTLSRCFPMGCLRFYLALAVVAWHTSHGWLPFISGEWAVRVFFVISGFYMSLALSSKYGDARTFWLNRALRLYPTYLLFVLIYWAWYFFTWMWLHKPPYGDWQVRYAAMEWWQAGLLVISNWTMIGQDIPCLFNFSPVTGFTYPGSPDALVDWAGRLRTIRPAWSLGTEAWFYLLVPFLVRLRTLHLLAIGTLSFSTFLFAPVFIAQFSLPTNLQFFIVGMLSFRHSTLSMTFFKATAKRRFDQFLGNLSYPIYISHSIIAAMMLNIFHSDSFFVVSSLSVITAGFVYFFLERPINVWRSIPIRSDHASGTMVLLPRPG